MLKIAFASNDRLRVNQHFGSTSGFAIYALDGERTRLIEVAEFAEEPMDGNENKLPARVEMLAGCAAVYCLAIGSSAVRQLVAGGVQPIRLECATPIEQILAELNRALHDRSIPWIERALGRHKDDDRFARMAGEGWQE